MPSLEGSDTTRDADSAWYAVYTRHQHEKNVARALVGKGFEAFLPLYTAVHRWKDRDKQLSLPLFPCYVFLRSPLDRWQPILTIPGVHSVLGFGGKRSMIPDSEVEAIRRMVASPLLAEPHPFLTCGDRVQLRAGPLQGLEGILLRKRSVWKLVVSVEMLQRSVAVEVDASMVERVSIKTPELRFGFAATTAH
ncbi:MAG: UpxY family transcription antiterminator [Candidatus Sulfotelmatobacter sp.]